MPDINIVYSFSTPEKQLLKQKVGTLNFTFRNWSDEDLMQIRSSLRKHYRDQQKGICCYCRNPVSLYSANNCQVEHIVPKSLYPDFMFNPKNICVICADCNEIKRQQEMLSEIPDTLGDGSGKKKYPWSSKSFKIVHPHLDEYSDHILRVGKMYTDKTDKGGFTIGACRLNRYVRNFGWEPEILNVPELLTFFDDIKDERDPAEQRKKLLSLTDKLMKTNL